MKKFNNRLVAILAISSASLVNTTSVLAANYPPSIQKPSFTNPTVSVGIPLEPVDTPTILKNATAKITTSIGDPIQVLIPSQKVGSVVTPTLTDSKGKKITLPKIVVGKNGVIDTKAIAISIPGTYVLAIKLPNGTTRSVTIKVTK